MKHEILKAYVRAIIRADDSAVDVYDRLPPTEAWKLARTQAHDLALALAANNPRIPRILSAPALDALDHGFDTLIVEGVRDTSCLPRCWQQFLSLRYEIGLSLSEISVRMNRHRPVVLAAWVHIHRRLMGGTDSLGALAFHYLNGWIDATEQRRLETLLAENPAAARQIADLAIRETSSPR